MNCKYKNHIYYCIFIIASLKDNKYCKGLILYVDIVKKSQIKGFQIICLLVRGDLDKLFRLIFEG